MSETPEPVSSTGTPQPNVIDFAAAKKRHDDKIIDVVLWDEMAENNAFQIEADE